MKNIFKISVVLLTMITLWSCEDDDEKTIAQGLTGPEIESPNQVLELIEEAEDITAFTLVWSDADYNVNTPVNYIIEIDKSGNNFADPSISGRTSDRLYSWSVKELNNVALTEGLIAGEQGSLDVRVKSAIGSDNFDEIISDPVILSVTPYEVFVPPVVTGGPNLFFVGDGTAAGWSNDNNNTPIFQNGDNDSVYTFTGKINGGSAGFKFLEIKGQWAPLYGQTDGAFTARPTESDPDPSPFSVATDGYYVVNVNLIENSITTESFDISGVTDYTTIEILGDSVDSNDTDADGTPDGWQTETDMTRSDFDSHLWNIQGITLGEGGLKFRANDDWNQSWGGTSFPSSTNSTGDNVTITPGTYDIWFNDITKNYIFLAVEP